MDETIISVNTIQVQLDEAFSACKKSIDTIEKAEAVINIARIGTLQGLSLAVVNDHNITPNDYISSAVLNRTRKYYKEETGGRRSLKKKKISLKRSLK